MRVVPRVILYIPVPEYGSVLGLFYVFIYANRDNVYKQSGQSTGKDFYFAEILFVLSLIAYMRYFYLYRRRSNQPTAESACYVSDGVARLG